MTYTLLILTCLALGLISLGMLFMLLAVSSAFVEMQTRAETAEKELAILLAELCQMVDAIEAQEDQDEATPLINKFLERPEGWYGMHES